MRFTHHICSITCILFFTAQTSSPVLAEGTEVIPVLPDTSADTESTPLGMAVSNGDLADYRGGTALQISAMNLDSKLINNQATANITGSNFVTQDAFSGSSGFSTVVQNSGNNVIIQNATILNLSLH
jgi:hypothetical protein